ncbi:MAG TPA: polyphosphate polymerase domain-containing protein [Planctomycetota bacterium]|nr:polyphosphate polymerase domain-containing protein [Planctomycetota bacterium]
MESSVNATPGPAEDPVDAAHSPGLRATAGGGPAFELKFELSQEDVFRMKAWAVRHLNPDPHGADGYYRVTSVYCDTPQFDVFHRSAGYRASKLRLRRYGSNSFIFLERKVKRGDQVRKRRVEVNPEDFQQLAACVNGKIPPVGWSAAWFLKHALRKQVAPTCRVGYRRTAYFGVSGRQNVRLTIDENLIGVPAQGWEAHSLQEGLDLLPGRALLELKFQHAMPELFRSLLPELPPQAARVSKYRRCVRLCGLARDRSEPAAPGTGTARGL